MVVLGKDRVAADATGGIISPAAAYRAEYAGAFRSNSAMEYRPKR